MACKMTTLRLRSISLLVGILSLSGCGTWWHGDQRRQKGSARHCHLWYGAATSR
jgi:hypothetical protein